MSKIHNRIPFLPRDADYVKVFPYIEQRYAPTFLAALWEKLQCEHVPKTFWRTGEPLSLNEWIRFFSPSEGRGLFIAVHCPSDNEPFTPNDIIGLMWVDQVQSHKANAHFFFFRQWWGGWTTAAVAKGLDVIFHEPFNLKVILCYINMDNKLGIGFWKRIGVTVLGEIPHYYQHGEQYYSALAGYIDRDMYYGKSI